MTNEELKEKIIKIYNDACAPAYIRGLKDRNGEELIPDIDVLADALIAAGLGDVKEVTHRAEVAERALQIAEDLGELCAPRQYYIDKAKRNLRRERRMSKESPFDIACKELNAIDNYNDLKRRKMTLAEYQTCWKILPYIKIYGRYETFIEGCAEFFKKCGFVVTKTEDGVSFLIEQKQGGHGNVDNRS